MALKDIWQILVPPKNGAATPGVTQWRWAIFIVVFLLLVNGAAGRGLIYGVGAYAAATDVQTLLELSFAEELRALRTQMCELPPERRATLERVIEGYQSRYVDLTGYRYPLKACEMS